MYATEKIIYIPAACRVITVWSFRRAFSDQNLTSTSTGWKLFS